MVTYWGQTRHNCRSRSSWKQSTWYKVNIHKQKSTLVFVVHAKKTCCKKQKQIAYHQMGYKERSNAYLALKQPLICLEPHLTGYTQRRAWSKKSDSACTHGFFSVWMVSDSKGLIKKMGHLNYFWWWCYYLFSVSFVFGNYLIVFI